MANFNYKPIEGYQKTVNVFLHKDIDIDAHFTIFTTNLGIVLQAIGPRKIDDVDQNSVYEVLNELETVARNSFVCRNFDDVELIKVKDGFYAVFYFKGLRKLEDGTYAAYYEFERVAGNDKSND